MVEYDGGAADSIASQVLDGGGAFQEPPTIVLDGGAAGYYRGISGTARPFPRNAFMGDPRLIMGPDGTRLQFVGGQPLMDTGLENLVLISLFTNEGWCGNAFMSSPIGSEFEAACNEPITKQSLNRIRAAAEKALVDPALGHATVTVDNPTGYQLRVRIMIEPPARTPQELTLIRNGANWQSQGDHPAYEHIRDTRWRKALISEKPGEMLRDESGILLEF